MGWFSAEHADERCCLPLGLKAVSERLPVVIIVITFLLFGIRDSAT
jgi:hypothetical protein